MARFARLFLILPGLALVLAACGSVHAGTASPDAATSATATPASPVRTAVPAGAVWKTIPVGLNTLTIHLAASGRVLLVPVQAPFGDRACLRDFRARLTAFRPAAAYVTIDYQAALIPGPDGLAGYGCPPGPVRTVRITLPAPLGHRQVILDHTATFWSAGAKRLRLCGTGGTVCQPLPPWPPPANCTAISYGQAMAATYPPAHSDYDAVGCLRPLAQESGLEIINSGG